MVHLDLPTTTLYPEQLKIVISHLRQLEMLDVEWSSNIKQLLELVDIDLKELTVRVKLKRASLSNASEFCKSVGLWVQYWASKPFIPRKLNIVLVEFKNIYPSVAMMENAMLNK